MSDLDRIINAVNLADLVGKTYELTNGHDNSRYIKAKQHNSLVVDLHRQVYYWNSKGESGDKVDWVGRHELNYNSQWNSTDPTLFKEAICWLARHAGLPEPQFKPEDAQARAERLTRDRLLTLAAEHYQRNLARDIQGWQYALLRGFTPATIEKSRLGVSGGLTEAIPQADHPTAVDLGLISQGKGGRYLDAIPPGYLVYTHYHRGKVEYLAGRCLAEKRHMNQRSPKKMFWATWPGYGGPLVIVEGQADAISLAQLGTSALAMCGVNLSDFDPDLIKLWSPIYVWQDADPADSEAAQAWSKRLADMAKVLGPLIRVIKSEAKDANGFLVNGGTPDDLQKLMSEAVTYLDSEIERLKPLKGATLYDELPGLFLKLSDLDIFQLNVYRSNICKALGVSQSDFGRYLKAAKGTLPDSEEDEFAKGGQYDVIDGWTVLRTVTESGNRKITPLANGNAQIIEEIVNDDGSNEPQLDFLVAGELATGQKLPRVQVASTEFPTMKWTAQWGARFILSAGRSTQDHFRAAMQHLSGTPYRRTIYTHTGWREINGKNFFLTSTGALGANDETIQVDLRMGRPDTNMTHYALPLAPQDIAPAMQASLQSWYIAEPSIIVPIWASMYLAPLFPFLTPDFGLWLYGVSGSMKSSMVACLLSHFGTWQGANAKLLLPSNFQSTANNILMSAFQAKDVPLVIDDYAPGANQKEVRERDNTASNLLRSVGNKAARGRMRDGRNFQADFPPRCLAIFTAEDVPKTSSIMARGIGVSISIPPKGDPARRPIEQRLTQAQTVDSFFYPHAMGGYILWIQRHWDELTKSLPVIAAGYRDQMSQAGGHARLPDAFGKLMAATDTALYFALDCGAITDSQATDKKRQAFEALGLMMSEHGEAVDSVDACRIFQETLLEQLDAREWYLCPADANSTSPPQNYPVGAQTVGYVDDNFIYLLTKTANDIMQIYQRLGTPFPVGRNTLYKRMIERGWLLPGAKATDVIHIPALGTSARVLKLVKQHLLEI